MLIVSSYRPFDVADKSYNDSQIIAKKSWEKTFSEIIYCGDDHLDPSMGCPKTKFIKVGNFPPIKFLTSIASLSKDDFSCIANSDIEFDPEKFKHVLTIMRARGAQCATSRRWSYAGSIEHATVVPGDYGLDIFIAKPDIWQQITNDIPEDFLIGHNGWDTWMLRYMSRFHFRNFTEHKCVFHPLHRKFADRVNKVPNIETAVGKEPHVLKI